MPVEQLFLNHSILRSTPEGRPRQVQPSIQIAELKKRFYSPHARLLREIFFWTVCHVSVLKNEFSNFTSIS